MRKLLIVLALGSALAGTAWGADATLSDSASSCLGIAKEFAGLSSRYGEKPKGIGESSNGYHVVLTVSKDGASWTIVGISGDHACPLDSGRNWKEAK
jgi:hypothetical protein